MSIIALVSINHNLLPQVEVYHCRDDLAAAMVLPNSLGEVVAVQVVVIVQLVQHIVAVFQAANAHLDALDDLRAGEGSLPGKADDFFLVGATGINVEQAAGDFPRNALQECQFEEQQHPQRPCRTDGDDEAAGEQIVQRIILGIPGANHNEPANKQTLHTVLPAAVDTPGHMDFLAEVYRSLAVLDGAILVISAKDGVQAQTRILFHALRKMNIPTVIFINKIDQAGVDLQSVVQSVRDKLSADIIIKQTVSLSPEIVLEENTDIEAWDAVIENNDELLEKYIAGEPISREKLAREEQQRVQDASLFPVYHGSAKNGLGIQPLMDAVTGLFQPIGEQGGAALCGSVFKVEYTDCGQRRVYLRLYSGTLRLRDTVALAGREKLKITEMRIPSKGEIVRTDTAYQGEIVILPSDSVRLNDVLGDQTRLPRKRWREDPLPMLRTTIAPKTAAQRERLLDALTQLADTDPLLRCEVDSITHEIILSFLGRVQLEVVSALLSEKYKLETVVKEPSVIYMERPLKAASHTIHIEVPPNPFWASIGLSVTPLSLGSGVQYESRVSLGYLNQSFQNAVRDGIRYGLEQGLFGWNVTDCKICFEYGLYYSPVSTPADFRSLAPIVLEQALKESGTQLLEPYLSFILYAPQEYLSRAYHDAPKYCATIETAQVKKDEVVFTGEIPARCIQAYRTDLAFYTNGRSVCLTELKGYQAAVGQPVIQPRRPNSRLDKVRHMFQKVM